MTLRFSSSRLKTWQTCALQAHFKYDQKLPEKQNAAASFGSVMHKCLDAYHNGHTVDECITMFKMYWENPDLLGVAPDYWPRYSSYGSLRDKGIELIKQYDGLNKWEKRKIIASEHRFLVSFGEFELTGTVDFLEVRNSGKGQKSLRIVDLKTSNSQPTKAELAFDLQFTVYAFASEQPEFWLGNGPNFPAMTKGAEHMETLRRATRMPVWFHLNGMKQINCGERDDDDYMRMYRLCKEIAAAEKANVHVPRIGQSCLWCPYQKPCGMEIPDLAKLEEQQGI